MNRRLFLQALSITLAAGNLPAARAGNKKFTVGIFPRYNIATTHSYFSPLLKYLGQRLGREVQLVTAKDFSSFWRTLKEQQFDLVHFNQYHYILAHKLYGYEAIIRNIEFGESTMAGSLVVRKDRHFEKVTDLKGKKILFGGDQTAMQSYIAATWLLRQAGLAAGDYQEAFAVNPPNAVISTYLGQSDAAGIGDVVIRLDAVKKSIDVNAMKYLARTEPMAQLPWAVHPRLDTDTKTRLQTILCTLQNDPGGQALLDKAAVSGFVITGDKDYDLHRRLIRDVYGENMGLERWR